MVIQTSKTTNIIIIILLGIMYFLMFYESCYDSEKEQNSRRIYEENTSYYISGQVLKTTEISSERYCLYVRPDSINIGKISPDLYYFSGIYDKKNDIVLVVAHLAFIDKKHQYKNEKYPYIIAQFDSDKKIDTLIHSNDNYGFRGVNNLIYVSNKFYGDFLTKQMDTMSDAIKFWNMRKFILFFTGGLIMLSVLFIFVNNFLASINDATYENEQRDFYRKNTFFYISGQVFKIEKIGNFSYALFVKTDSVNILSSENRRDRVSGVFDEDKKIAILLSRSKSRLGIVKTDSNTLPYLTYMCNPKIGKYGFTFSDNKLELDEDMWDTDKKTTIAQYLFQQMDTIPNGIEF